MKGSFILNKEEKMLNGNLFKTILLFSLPLMLSNILQVLFNMTDIAVVGKFGSSIALGAVGSTVMLVSFYTSFVMGIGNGVNVFVARYLGQNDYDKVKRIVHSGFYVSIVTGLVLSALSISLSFPMLKLLGTKDELINEASIYCFIYFTGLPAMAIYNYGNGVLSASGETKKPLFILIVSGLMNLGLNLFLVICFNLGVVGVAVSSAISQYISAIAIIVILITSKGHNKLYLKAVKTDLKSVKEILYIGIPSGLQYSIFSIANMFIQSGINSFDHVTVEGVSAATNADSFIYESMFAIYAACASFISINYGAGKMNRVKKSYFICLLYSFSLGLILGGLLFIFGRQFLSLFTNDEMVIESGLDRIKIMGLIYCISAFMDNTTAAARGLGKSFAPTVIVILGSCIFRIVWLYAVFYPIHTIESLFLVYPTSWIITAVVEIIYFIHTYKLANKLHTNSVALQ